MASTTAVDTKDTATLTPTSSKEQEEKIQTGKATDQTHKDGKEYSHYIADQSYEWQQF